MSFEFFPNEQSATLLNAARHPSLTPEAGTFDNFASGAGNYTMRSLAEVGRAIDMAGAVFPVAIDAVTGGTERQDQYFAEHEDVYQRAVDYWTPAPIEVGAAGQIAGQLAGGVLQAVVSPALLVGSAQLSGAEDLVRQNIDAGTANVVGDITGIGTAVGVRLPYLGKTLATRVLSGAGGNVAQGMAMAGASHAVLDAAGNTQEAQQYDAFDLRARTLDVLLGAAFGRLAHHDAKLSATDEAALLVANQARHMEDSTLGGRPASDADATMHVDAMRKAIDQVLRGEPVQVDDVVLGMRIEPDEAMLRQRVEIADELARLAREEIPETAPIEPLTRAQADAPPAEGETLAAKVMQTLGEALGIKPPETGTPDAADPVIAQGRQAVADYPDMMVPTGDVSPDGSPVHVRAADAIAQADAELARARTTTPEIFRIAASCLLGAL